MTEVLVPFINSLIVLDLEGNRLFAKYYDGRKKAEQINNELVLFKVSHTTDNSSFKQIYF